MQSGMAEREMQSASLKEAELACRRLELEVKESVERAARVEAERDAACHEAAMAKLEIEGAINTRAQVESELTRVQRALAVVDDARLKAESEREAAQKALFLAGEACTKVEEENSRLTDERLSLILELWTIKDGFAALWEKSIADREAMEAEFNASGDTLFNYGYGCYVFTHNICGSKPQIPDGMSDPSVPLTPVFFANLRCPPSTSSATPALDPTSVGREERPRNSPTASREEATLPMDPSASLDDEVKDAVAN